VSTGLWGNDTSSRRYMQDKKSNIYILTSNLLIKGLIATLLSWWKVIQVMYRIRSCLWSDHHSVFRPFHVVPKLGCFFNYPDMKSNSARR